MFSIALEGASTQAMILGVLAGAKESRSNAYMGGTLLYSDLKVI
jgi:hypothetical protein